MVVGALIVAYSLFINDSLVSQPDIPIVLDNLTRSYDAPAVLTFRLAGDWRPARRYNWAADSPVRLEQDGQTVFAGLLDLPEPVAQQNNYAVQYRAFDHSRVYRSAVSTDGWTTIVLDAGPLATVLAQYLAHVGATLESIGVSRLPLFGGGAESINCLPSMIVNSTIDAGMRQIAANAPGVRCYMHPKNPNDAQDRPAYAFVNIFGTPYYPVTLDVTRIEQFTVRQSLEGRAGAVRTTARTATGQPVQSTQPLRPAWNGALEESWTIEQATSLNEDGTESEMSPVYRLWSFADVGGAVNQSGPVSAEIRLPGFEPVLYAKVEIASIDWTTKTVLLKYPAVYSPGRRNPSGAKNVHVPGSAKPASEVRLLFTVSGSGGGAAFPGARYPETGFAGRAFAMAPISMAYERQVDVPPGVDYVAYARDAWAAISEPLVEGTLPILGTMPYDLFFMDRRITFRTGTHGPTGYEGLNAPINGVRVAFDKGESVEIDFSTDRTIVLRGGLG